MKKFKFLVLAFLGLTTLKADGFLLDVEAGAGIWWASPSGNYDSTASLSDSIVSNIDTDQKLGLEDEQTQYIWINIKHFLPVIPNVRVDMAKVGIQGSKNISENFYFANQEFSSGMDVKTDMQLDQLDISLYWSFLGKLLPLVDIDVGLGLKYFDGYTKVEGTSDSETTKEQLDINLPLPYVYGRLAVDIPMTNITADFDIKYFEFSDLIDAKMVDSRLKLDAEVLTLPLVSAHLELGYRIQILEITSGGGETLIDGFDGSISNDLSGVFGGLNVRFGL